VLEDAGPRTWRPRIVSDDPSMKNRSPGKPCRRCGGKGKAVPRRWPVVSFVICVAVGAIASGRSWSGGALLTALVVAVGLLTLVGIALRQECPRCQGRGVEDRSETGEPPPKCRRCGYNLTGQSVPRCPECGCAIGFDKTFEELGLTDEEARAASDLSGRKRS